MNGYECTLCKMVLTIVGSGFVAAILIKLSSAYKYVAVFV